MGDGSIADFQISASSEDLDYPAVNARLFNSGWCADSLDSQPYFQVIYYSVLTPREIIHFTNIVPVHL